MGDLRSALVDSMAGAPSALEAADRLCRACVDVLGVDGASISVADGITTQGTFGSSGELSRRLDEYQFTFGEGPCLDAVRGGVPVIAADLSSTTEDRWPAFRDAVLTAGICAVFALPVGLQARPFGALDLFNRTRGELTDRALSGGLVAAELAAAPLLKMMGSAREMADSAEGELGWDQLASLERVEVYQATGMVIAALNVSPDDALIRLRAYAYAHGLTASEAAWRVLDREANLHDDGWGSGGRAGDDDRD
ncbi:GAF and ANTAR domain-containing protein [Cellulomonas rhizosphaerae]|uniref:ANTAR domain-containing protein n=1 Tax=Cellulomonas rhizosphaerae TaxID=2293719 RepID=A0A413RQA9_9CELL|nr:GAF and ANTAR domain-containing protein [Cellulomonas rhizosphaerae]RHA44101.1 ANTAR domain-containing protein [Cellulomonas rhizosphaerae]